jgi:hypothetical protein
MEFLIPSLNFRLFVHMIYTKTKDELVPSVKHVERNLELPRFLFLFGCTIGDVISDGGFIPH